MPTNGFSIKPLRVKLLAEEWKATELNHHSEVHFEDVTLTDPPFAGYRHPPLLGPGVMF